MKVTFQFFMCNPDQIPQDFMKKYQRDGEQIYTDQQIVSAFIASFTNEGLNGLYNGLVERKLVLSRAEAMAQLKAVRPDLDVDGMASRVFKWVNPQNKDEKVKIAANDILEFIFEQEVGRSIVAGKIGPDGQKKIPDIQHQIAVRDYVKGNFVTVIEQVVEQRPELLESAIDVSRSEINSEELKAMVQSIIDKQRSEEIDVHIDEARKKLESEGQEL